MLKSKNKVIDKSKFPILIYDHKCHLCCRFIQTIQRLPNSDKIQSVSLHQQELYQSFPSLTFEECNKTVHLISNDLKIYKGADVIVYLTKYFPKISKFSWLIEKGMGKKALEVFYESVQGQRKKIIEKCPNC